MEQKIFGDLSAVKTSVIEYMETFADGVYSPGEFFPEEILAMLFTVTCEIGREAAVYLDRKNRVVALCIGDDKSVSLPEAEGKRSKTRTLGIRIIHTHPNATVTPSEVDLNSLKTMRLDAMCVVGVNCEKKTISGLSATILSRDAKGMLTETELRGPYLPSQRKRFDSIFGEIEELDRTAENIAEDTENGPEKAILVSIDGEPDELRELAQSAGATVVGAVVQKRTEPDGRYYIGKGAAESLSLTVKAKGADICICDDELSPSTVKNLENLTGVPVIDRTTLILDIFAKRAKSREGRLQVELAQQKYRLPRLMGLGTQLSRLGGGIGTRGPGETKLQSDRRHIMRRIHYLEQEIRNISDHRELLRKERKKKMLPVIAAVGYTNAGKSTLVNALCNSDIFAENMLFATLDPSVRRLVTPDKNDFLMIDTVGFVRKLPHELVEAFKSTLEEAVYADLLLHVVDGSNPEMASQMETVDNILKEIGAENRPVYTVINKTDNPDCVKEGIPGKTFYVSAKTGEGLDNLRDAIIRFFTCTDKKFELVIPYSEGSKLSYLHDKGTVEAEEYRDDGVYVKGHIPAEFWRFEES